MDECFIVNVQSYLIACFMFRYLLLQAVPNRYFRILVYSFFQEFCARSQADHTQCLSMQILSVIHAGDSM